jgi:hypothetical protein
MSDSSHWMARAWQSVWGSLHAEPGQEPQRHKSRRITNTTDGLLLLVTEPEGQDFWLQPGETVELRAEVDAESDDFELREEDQEIVVWPSPGMGYISAWLDGQLLACGHRRPTESPLPVPPSRYGTLR